MKDRVAAIIYKDNKVILMHREKGYGESKKIYNVIPGGGIEEGESIEDALRREIREEVGVEIDIIDYNEPFILNDSGRKQYFFYCKYKSGIVGTGTGDEVKNENYELHGSYQIIEITENEITTLDIRPIELKNIIIKGFKEKVEEE